MSIEKRRWVSLNIHVLQKILTWINKNNIGLGFGVSLFNVGDGNGKNNTRYHCWTRFIFSATWVAGRQTLLWVQALESAAWPRRPNNIFQVLLQNDSYTGSPRENLFANKIRWMIYSPPFIGLVTRWWWRRSVGRLGGRRAVHDITCEGEHTVLHGVWCVHT